MIPWGFVQREQILTQEMLLGAAALHSKSPLKREALLAQGPLLEDPARTLIWLMAYARVHRCKTSSRTLYVGCRLFSFCCLAAKLCPTLLQPARLLCPWAFPGKNTGVGCHVLLQGMFLTQGSNPCLCTKGRFLNPEPPYTSMKKISLNTYTHSHTYT